MNREEHRNLLLVELEDVLDLYGPHSARWPEKQKARLCALIETDKEAMKLLAEAKAFDKLLGCCRKGETRPDLEKCILNAVCNLPQQHRPRPVDPVVDHRYGRRSVGNGSALSARRWPWREAALLAASLGVGIYIGLSGDALPTLRDLNMMASADMTAGAAIAGSLVGPSALHDQEPL